MSEGNSSLVLAGITEHLLGVTENYLGISEGYLGVTEKYLNASESYFGVSEKYLGGSWTTELVEEEEEELDCGTLPNIARVKVIHSQF